MCVGCPFFLIKSFSPATRSAFIYMPQSLCRSKKALTVQAILTGFGGSSLLQDGCISQYWMHLSGSKQWPALWAGNWTLEGTKTGQTHRSPHFCQASPVPAVMTTAKLSHEVHIMLRSAHTVHQPKVSVGLKQQCSLLVTEEETMGREGKRQTSLFIGDNLLTNFSVKY